MGVMVYVWSRWIFEKDTYEMVRLGLGSDCGGF